MTITEQAPAVAEATAEDAAPVSPVLGEVVIGTHDGTRVIRWTLGATPGNHGLTVPGMAAAAAATGRYLAEVNPRAVARSPVVVIRPHDWAIPAATGHETAVAAMMTEVVNAAGSIGQLS